MWNEFDNRFMRDVFGGNPHDNGSIIMDPNSIAAVGAYNLNPALHGGELLPSPVRRSQQQPHHLFPLTENSANSNVPRGSSHSIVSLDGVGREETKRADVVAGGGAGGGAGAVPPMSVPSGGQPI